MSGKYVIAVDLGASSGRVMKVSFDGERFALEQAHRFATPGDGHGTIIGTCCACGTDHRGHRAAADGAASRDRSWGVDFALLDRNGDLLANPVHYRDSRTDGMPEWVFERVRRTVFERTGIQIMNINTLYQLASLAAANSPSLDCAETLLSFPNLLSYWMTGARVCEFTHVTTMQCYNPVARDWDRATLAAIGVPTHIFPEIVPPGTRLGEYEGIPVLAPACHDTADAVAAVPTDRELPISQRYVEPDRPGSQRAGDQRRCVREPTRPRAASGPPPATKRDGPVAPAGSAATWAAAGARPTELIHEAEAAPPFRSLIDRTTTGFLAPGDMPAASAPTAAGRTSRSRRRSGRPSAPFTRAWPCATGSCSTR